MAKPKIKMPPEIAEAIWAAYKEWKALPRPTLTDWMRERFSKLDTSDSLTWGRRVSRAQAVLLTMEKIKEWNEQHRKEQP